MKQPQQQQEKKSRKRERHTLMFKVLQCIYIFESTDREIYL